MKTPLLDVASEALKGDTFEHMSIASDAINLQREANAELTDFIRRVERGDPRLCKPGYENPRYFEKFGED